MEDKGSLRGRGLGGRERRLPAVALENVMISEMFVQPRSRVEIFFLSASRQTKKPSRLPKASC